MNKGWELGSAAIAELHDMYEGCCIDDSQGDIYGWEKYIAHEAQRKLLDYWACCNTEQWLKCQAAILGIEK